ncbi:MAG TPA: hypothetical protein VLL51_02980, partial [Gemmatimonadales bacterium]|nr:hypothetical protein [Gemmatimonadales bacterium]
MRTLLALLVLVSPAMAQRPSAGSDSTGRFSSGTIAALRLRNIGPGLASGRVADIAVDPADKSTWYVGVASGGVWKTENAGVTWTPIFDDQGSYSIGTL